MNNLILFEAFEKPIPSVNKDGNFSIGNFDTFIKKYNKTNYVSKREIKKFNSSDIKFDYFKELENQVEKCIDFISNNDMDILDDILLDIRDDFSFEIDHRFFKLKYKDGSYWDSNDMNIYLKPEETSIDDKYDIMNKIITGIAKSREILIHTTKEKILNKSGEKYDRYYNKTKLASMGGKNPFSKIKVSPRLEIEADLLFYNNNYWGLENSEERREIIERNYKIMDDFQKALKSCVLRYLDAIGYQNVKFSLYVSHGYVIIVDFF